MLKLESSLALRDNPEILGILYGKRHVPFLPYGKIPKRNFRNIFINSKQPVSNHLDDNTTAFEEPIDPCEFCSKTPFYRLKLVKPFSHPRRPRG